MRVCILPGQHKLEMSVSLQSWLADLMGRTEPSPVFSADDYRLAAAALMFHVAMVDGVMREAETARMKLTLARAFSLDARTADRLYDEARAADIEAVDVDGFAAILKRSLDAESRLHLVQLLWDVVLADGLVSEIEESAIFRAAELIEVPTADVLRARRAMSQKDA